jgi:hypothetical protein
MVDIEYVDAECWSGSTYVVNKIPLVHCPRMKMKDFIQDSFGRNFGDEDSTESTVLYIMENFLKWYKEQTYALEQAADYR